MLQNTLENNKFSLRLANGDMINLTFPRNHIPHILGINIDKLKTLTDAFESIKNIQ